MAAGKRRKVAGRKVSGGSGRFWVRGFGRSAPVRRKSAAPPRKRRGKK